MPASQYRIPLIAWAFLLVLIFIGGLLGPIGLAGGPVGAPLPLAHLLHLAANTLFVSATAALIAICVALVPAAVAARGGACTPFILAAMTAPILLPPAVVALAMVRLFGPAGVLESCGIPNPGAGVFSLLGTAFSLAIAFLPAAALPAWLFLRLVSGDIEAAARLDASPMQRWAAIILPLAAPGFALGAVLVFLLAATEFAAPEALRSQPVLVSEVYRQFGVYYDTRGAIGASLVLIGLVAAGGAALLPLLRFSQEDSSTESPIRRAASAPWQAIAIGIAILPVGLVVSALVLTTTGPQGPLAVLRLTWSLAAEELFFTAWLACLAAILAAGVGALLGVSLAKSKDPWPVRLLVLTGFLIPGPVTAVAMKSMLNGGAGVLPGAAGDFLASIDRSLAPLILAWIVRFAPLAAILVEARLRALRGDLRDAAILEATGPRAWWFTWGWPVAFPIAATLVALLIPLIATESGAAALLLPPGPTTLPIRLMTLMHYAPTGQVSALALLLLSPSLLAAIAMYAIARFHRNNAG